MRARPILATSMLAVLVSPRGYAAHGEVYALVGGRVLTVSGPVIEKGTARAYGRPAEIALRAITLSPAEIFGVADRMGALDVGKDAMDHRTQVTHVFVNGVAQSLETRHTRLYREFKDRP